jgi:ribosomal protein S27E
MTDNMSLPSHCPGFTTFRNLKSFTCKCPNCSEELEIFSDEFDKPHTCKSCGKPIDFTQCTLTGEGASISPR